VPIERGEGFGAYLAGRRVKLGRGADDGQAGGGHDAAMNPVPAFVVVVRRA
jgi:hypothetical protein